MVQGVLDKFARRSTERFLIGALNGGHGGVVLVDVAAGEGCIIRAAVVISPANGVKRINYVGVVAAGSTAMALLRTPDIALNAVERSVRHDVAGVSLVRKLAAVAVLGGVRQAAGSLWRGCGLRLKGLLRRVAGNSQVSL